MTCGGGGTADAKWQWQGPVWFFPFVYTAIPYPNFNVTVTFTPSARCISKGCKKPDAPLWACGYCADCHRGGGCFA